MLQNIKLNYILLGAALFLVVIVIIMAILSFNNSSPQTQDITVDPTPTAVPVTTSTVPLKRSTGEPVAIGSLPKKQVPGGTAPDLKAPAISTSQQELTALFPHLPFVVDVTLSTDRKVSIVVPSRQYQDAPWKLTAQVFNIDYRIPISSKNYATEKAAFLESASYIFGWMKQHKVNPDNVIIKWGDEAYIQQRAEEWLKIQ